MNTIERRVQKWFDGTESRGGYFSIISPYEIKSGDLIIMLETDGLMVNREGFVFEATSDAMISDDGIPYFENIEKEFVYPEDDEGFVITSWNNEDKYKGEFQCKDKDDAIRLYNLNSGLVKLEGYEDFDRCDNIVVEKINRFERRELVVSCYYPEVPEKIEV